MFQIRSRSTVPALAKGGMHLHCKKLTEQGYEEIGSGCNGIVMQAPGAENVLKFFSARDGGYSAFVYFIQKQRKNGRKFRTLPQTFGRPIRFEDNSGRDFFALEMEKLQPFPEYYRGRSANTWVSDLAGFLFNGEYTPSQIKERCRLTDRELKEMKAFQRYLKPYRNYRHKKNATYLGNDLGTKNVMVRGDSFVLTDPCYA